MLDLPANQTTIQIGQRTIGGVHSCYVVAEIGLNHNGDPNLARRLIDEAATCGVDAVKFQKRSVGDLLIREYLDMPYSGSNSYGRTYGDHRSALELPDDAWPILKEHAEKRGLSFFASAWDEPSVDFLERIGVLAYKIASADVTNIPLLRKVAASGKPILLSTGMSTLEEIDEAVDEIRHLNDQIVVMHCISTYPCNDEEANLRLIRVMAERYPQAVIGYSGHEKSGFVVSVAAVALGAKVVERHFTLDRTLRGPDHAASLEPQGMAFLVENIRKIESALGTGEKEILPAEWTVRFKLAKSVVATTDISAGTVITSEMLGVKGPGTGIKPKYLPFIVGRTSAVDIEADTVLPQEALTWHRPR